ncbi:MAG TPA: hypothetical protein PLL20_21505 [Phycisphaerae bacterium]|nr:hypothetical protein [Phycisphaerae bacterium]
MRSVNSAKPSRGFRRVLLAFCLLSPVFCLLPAPAWALQTCAQSAAFTIDNRPFNNGRIAYHSYSGYLHPPSGNNGAMHLYDLGTSLQPTNVTAGMSLSNAMNPSFSPDGRLITFMAIPSGEPLVRSSLRVYVYDCVKKTVSTPFPLREPGEAAVMAEDPRFSPDGARIIFKGNDRIWTMTRDGRNARELTNQFEDERSGPNYEPTNGSRIVYWKGGCPFGDIYWALKDGTDESCLFGTDTDCAVRQLGDCLNDYYPVFWDSNRILFASWDKFVSSAPDCDCQELPNPDDDLHLYTISPPSLETLWRLNTDTYDESDPFVVDSSWIGFSSTRGGNGHYDLYLGNPTTGQIMPLASLNDNLHQLGGSYSPVPQAYVHKIPESVVMAGRVATGEGGTSKGATDTATGIPDMEVSFSGLGTVVTDYAGYYARLVPAGWSGTISVSLEAPETANAGLRQLAEDSGQLMFGTRVYNYVGGDLSGEDWWGGCRMCPRRC